MASSPIEPIEDITGQAGWMFSDMLIALMVVFLATISFIPQVAGGGSSVFDPGSDAATSANSGTGDGSYTYTENFEPEFVAVYELANAKNLVTDIQVFFKQNGIPVNAVVNSVQLVGGYSPTEESYLAIEKAAVFQQRLDKLFPGIFDRASTVLNSSSKLSTAVVAVRMKFSANVTVNR